MLIALIFLLGIFKLSAISCQQSAISSEYFIKFTNSASLLVLSQSCATIEYEQGSSAKLEAYY